MMNITIKSFIKKEFIQMLRDPRMKVLIFILPVIQLILFGFALTNDVKNIRLSCSYSYNDTMAAHFYDRALASGWFVNTSIKIKDPYSQIMNNDAEAVLVLPSEGLTRSVVRGQTDVQLLINSTNLLRARAIELYVKNILNNVVNDDYIKKLPLTANLQTNLKFNIRTLYNPTMESSIFMVPGVICMIVSIISIILTSMAIAKEKEQGTFEMLISSPITTWELIIGKTVPYFIVGLVDIVLVLVAGIILFDLPVRGSIFALALVSFVFLATTVSVGMLISTFARTQQQGMLGGFIFIFPAIMFSGIMVPIDNMPFILKIFAYIDPLKYYASLLRNILLKGGNLEFILLNTGVLLLIAIITIYISIRLFKNTLE